MSVSKKYRIATWNLERPLRVSPANQLALQKIEELNPDIIVLTETSNLIDLGSEYFSVKSKPVVKYPNEQWATIWTKWPVVCELHTYNDTRATCALIRAPFGDIIVYGTILPYHGAGVSGGKYPEQGCANWELHEKSIIGLDSDLIKIKSEYPSSTICIAGDFNQTRDNQSRGYGVNHLRSLLGEILRKNEVVCLTEENFEVSGKLKPNPKTGKTRKNIDHICFSSALISSFHSMEVNAWDHFTDDNVFMSDHNGVLIDFDLP